MLFPKRSKPLAGSGYSSASDQAKAYRAYSGKMGEMDMNNSLAATTFNFVPAPIAAQNRAVNCALIVVGHIALMMLGAAISHSLGAQMQTMKGFEALTFGVYLIGGSSYTTALYSRNKKLTAAITGGATSAILAFLGGMLLA